jgi:DNA-binding transcriptional LysR family regulator
VVNEREAETVRAIYRSAAEQFAELRSERQQGLGMLAHKRVETLLAEPDERGIADGDAGRHLRPVEEQRVFADEVRLTTSPQLVDLQREEVDMAVRYGRGNWPGLRCEWLMAEDIFPVCSWGHQRDNRREGSAA